MEKMDVIKFIKAQIDTEMAKLKDVRYDDMYARGKILAYTDVTRMPLEACPADYVEGIDNKNKRKRLYINHTQVAVEPFAHSETFPLTMKLFLPQ